MGRHFAAEGRIRTWDAILRPKAALEHGMSFQYIHQILVFMCIQEAPKVPLKSFRNPTNLNVVEETIVCSTNLNVVEETIVSLGNHNHIGKRVFDVCILI